MNVIELFNKHKRAFNNECRSLVSKCEGKQFYTTVHPIDALFMYFSILDKNPESAIEFAPHVGYSTCFIALAMKQLGKNTFYTFEKSPNITELVNNLKEYGVNDYANIKVGDALVEVPKWINEQKTNVQFCFVDCEHSHKMSKGYTNNIFPLLSNDCLICIHDISYKKNAQYGDLASNVKGHINDEFKGVKDWVLKNQYKYHLLHQIFGGKFEKSDDIAVNNKLYDQIEDVLGIDFRQYKRSCPLLFISERNVHE